MTYKIQISSVHAIFLNLWRNLMSEGILVSETAVWKVSFIKQIMFTKTRPCGEMNSRLKWVVNVILYHHATVFPLRK